MIFKHPCYAVHLDLNGRIIHEIKSGDMNSEIIIGRSSDCTWQIPQEDRGASSHHAKLFRKGKLIFIRDMESRNGIYFMGEKIHERKLSAGDIYSIGDCKLLVEEATDSKVENKTGVQYHQLEQLSGKERGKIYQLKEDNIKIGAADSCSIVLNDSLVSHLHAVIENHKDGTCWVKDMKSRNGTKVNGTPLSEENAETGRMLKDGDIVSVAYLDFRFWDKSVTHIRSHILLKCGIVVATLAIALGGYFTFQTISPSAKTIRLRAERYAAVENFDKAQEILQSAATARGADSDAVQRQDLTRKINLWRTTTKTWVEIKNLLGKSFSEGAMYDANDLFANLVSSDREQWQWNASNAATEMKIAQETHALLSALLSAEERINHSDRDVEYIAVLTGKLEHGIAVCRKNRQPFQAGLLARAEELVAEMKTLAKEYHDISVLMSQYNAVNDTRKIISNLEQYHENSKKRFAERKKKGIAASRFVVSYCEKLLAPLHELENSRTTLVKNYTHVANFEFTKFRKSLKLPTAEQCIVASSLSMRRADMERSNQNLERIIIQLRNFKMYFEQNEIGPQKRSALLENLFQDDIWEVILSCDCLKQKQPLYSDKTARSSYDQILGVYTFWEYLKSVDGEFDTTIFEDRFKPDMFRSKDVFNYLENFTKFCKSNPRMPFYTDIQILMSANNGSNKLKAYMLSAKKILEQRDSLVEKLYRIYQREHNSRRGIIAGGAALCLASRNGKLDEEKMAKELSSYLRSLRRTLAQIVEKNQNIAPEQILLNEKKLLEIGIPGDPFLKQPWTDSGERRK